MPCHPVTTPEGLRAIVCTRSTPRRTCSRCDAEATILCDFVAQGARRRCSAALCERHAVQVGPDHHHCPHHPRQARPEQLGLFGGGS